VMVVVRVYISQDYLGVSSGLAPRRSDTTLISLRY
jgi:hypothetical protein